MDSVGTVDSHNTVLGAFWCHGLLASIAVAIDIRFPLLWLH